jgi:hypothetical protein
MQEQEEGPEDDALVEMRTRLMELSLKARVDEKSKDDVAQSNGRNSDCSLVKRFS